MFFKILIFSILFIIFFVILYILYDTEKNNIERE